MNEKCIRSVRRARLVDGREADARTGGQLVREVLHHALQARGRLERRLAGVRVLPPHTLASGCWASRCYHACTALARALTSLLQSNCTLDTSMVWKILNLWRGHNGKEDM